MSKRFLFPFSAVRPNLKKYWWHRLLIVLFAISVVLSGGGIWLSMQGSDVSGYTSCLMIASDFGEQTYSASQLAAQQAQCAIADPINTWTNFGSGLVVAIVVFYLLQLIYYKVVLFVVFGSPKKKHDES